MVQKGQKTQRGKTAEKKRQSVILYYAHKMSEWLYRLVLYSAIGRFMTGYHKTEDHMREGLVYRLLRGKTKRSDRWSFRFRLRFSAMIEESLVCRVLQRIVHTLLQCSLSTYGLFFLFMGIYSVVSYYVTGNITPDTGDMAHVLTGGAMILFSLPLFASTASLAAGLRRSRVMHGLLIGVLGVRKTAFGGYAEQGEEHHLQALFLSLVGGAVTFFVPPYQMLLVLALLLFVWLVMSYPEVGMMASIIVAPFLGLAPHPTYVLLALVSLTVFSYVFKLICGKRTLRFGLLDGAVVLMLSVLLLGGLFSAGGKASLHSAATYGCLILIYFVVSNLARSDEHVNRVMGALLVPCVLMAIIGVLQYFLGDLPTQYVDLSLFADLGGRASALMGNPNFLAEYLVLLLPLLMGVMLRQSRLLHGFGYAVCAAVVAGCLILTWSRGAWLGAIAAALLLLLGMSHRSLSWLMISIIPVFAAIGFLPSKILRRFVSIGNLSDSSIHYRLNLWEGVWDMLQEYWLCGVGVGEDAFRRVYVHYALPGIETAMHAHSLYLQLLCGLGVVGLIVFVGVIVLWLRRSMEFCRYRRVKSQRLTVLAGMAGIVALLCMGCFDDVWYNYRIFFLFWTVMGLVNAQVRGGWLEEERAYNPMNNERTQGEATLRFP